MEFYSLIVFILFVGFLNASVSITLLNWMERGMVLGQFRFWLAKQLLPNSGVKDKIFEDLEFVKKPNPFISVYKETEKVGYLTFENWKILSELELGYEPFFMNKVGVTETEIEKYLGESKLTYETFKRIWGFCPLENLEQRQKAIEACENRMINLAKETTFWFKPLGGCLHCFHVWLLPITFGICLGYFSIFYKLSLWLIAAFFGSLFISGNLVILFDKQK